MNVYLKCSNWIHGEAIQRMCDRKLTAIETSEDSAECFGCCWFLACFSTSRFIDRNHSLKIEDESPRQKVDERNKTAPHFRVCRSLIETRRYDKSQSKLHTPLPALTHNRFE